MIIKHEVELFGLLNTVSKLYVDGKFYGYALEDPMREKKISKITGIPLGDHAVKLTYSPKFSAKYDGKAIPEIMAPGFAGIRIHSGNTELDTDGCILVGSSIVEREDGKGWIVKDTAKLSRNLNLLIMNEINSGKKVIWKKINGIVTMLCFLLLFSSILLITLF